MDQIYETSKDYRHNNGRYKFKPKRSWILKAEIAIMVVSAIILIIGAFVMQNAVDPGLSDVPLTYIAPAAHNV